MKNAFKFIKKAFGVIGFSSMMLAPVITVNATDMEDYDGNYVSSNPDILNHITTDKVDDTIDEVVIFNGSDFYMKNDSLTQDEKNALAYEKYLERALELLKQGDFFTVDEEGFRQTGSIEGNLTPNWNAVFKAIADNQDNYFNMWSDIAQGLIQNKDSIQEMLKSFANDSRIKDLIDKLTEAFGDSDTSTDDSSNDSSDMTSDKTDSSETKDESTNDSTE